ncbi:MAG: trypsin-like peptidase domain-containing protein [Actinobacteria bacterium]|nr:trypsin-like peptidase domain-containing protein [Actinomycetota bacterium]
MDSVVFDPEEQRRPASARAAVACAAALIVLAGCSHVRPSTSLPAATTAATVDRSAASLQDAFEHVVDRVRPSVVEISTGSGLGSGVVYDGQGDVVTNAHVVGDSTTFKVTLGDGRTLPAGLVGTFAPDDLAVIKLNGSSLPPPATFADSSKVHVGAISLAVGNPLGLASSVTQGIVSFNGRTVAEGGGVVLPSTIQTSAAINPGNSGGALADIDGNVIGIPTLAATDPELNGSIAAGIGFAIPSNTVKTIGDQLVRRGKVTTSGRAALGIQATDAVAESGDPTGVLVRSTEPHSGAAAAGIGPGDVILSVDGKPTPDLGALADILAAKNPGDRVRVEVTKPDGSTKTYDVTLSDLSTP